MLKRKILYLLALPWVWMGCGRNNTLDYEDSQERNGIIYEIDAQEPFSGTLIRYYEPKSTNSWKRHIALKIGIKKGLYHGLFEDFSSNGDLFLSTTM